MRFDVHNMSELLWAANELAHTPYGEHSTLVVFDGLDPTRFRFEADKVVQELCDERGMALGY